jgi:hypothetical protein
MIPEEEKRKAASPRESKSDIRYYEGGGDLSQLEGKVFDVSDIVADQKERQALEARIRDLEAGVNETIYEIGDDQLVEAVKEYARPVEAEDKLAAGFFREGEKMDEAHRAGRDYAEAKLAADMLKPPSPEDARKAVRNEGLPKEHQEALAEKIRAGRAMLEVAKADLTNLFNKFAETYAVDPDSLLEEKSVSKIAALKIGLKSVFRPGYRKTLRAYEAKIAEVHRLEDELRADSMALNDPAGYADEMNRRMLRMVEMSARVAGVFTAEPPGGRREMPPSASIMEATDDEIDEAAEEIRAAKMAEISAGAEDKSVEIESPMDTELELAWEKEGVKMDKAHAEGLDYAQEKEIAEAKRAPTKEEAESFAKRGEISPEMIKAAHNRMAEREVEIKVTRHQLDAIEAKMLRDYGLNPAILLKEKTFSKAAALRTGLRSLFDGGFRKLMRKYEALVEESGRLHAEQADDDLLTKDPKAFGAEMARRTVRAVVAGAAASRRAGSSPRGTLGIGPTSM